MGAAWSEISFEVYHVFISQKLKKLKEEESLPFSPSSAADFLEPGYLILLPPWAEKDRGTSDIVWLFLNYVPG